MAQSQVKSAVLRKLARPAARDGSAVPAVIVKQGLDRGMSSLLRSAASLKVVDAVSLTQAVDVLGHIAEYVRKVDAATEPIISATHTAWKAALAQKAAFLGPAETERLRLRGEMAEYKTEQDRLRQIAEEASQRERERLEAAERARVEAETRRLEAAARAANEKAAKIAEKRGDQKFAQALRVAPINVDPVPMRAVFVPPVDVEPVEAEGLGFRKDWYANVLSLEQLVRGIAAGGASVACVEAAQSVLDKMAKALKNHMNIPGVEALYRNVPIEKKRV